MADFSVKDINEIIACAELENPISEKTAKKLLYFMKRIKSYGGIPKEGFCCSQEMQGRGKCNVLCSSCKELYNSDY